MIDPAQLATSFDAYAATLVLFARQWLVRSAAEDVVQDVFVNLLLQRRAPDNLKAWLFKAVRNAAISHARSATRRGNREKRHAVHRPDWFEPRPEDLIDAATAQQALESLAPEQREVIVLRIWGQMTFEEAAAALEISPNTAASRYRYGLAKLKEQLAPLPKE